MAAISSAPQPRSRLPIILIAAAVIVILAGVVLSQGRSTVPIRVDKAVRQDLVNTLSTNGKVEPADNFEAHAPTQSTVKKILVKEGQAVMPGQLMLTLDDSDARAQAARALAQLKAAQADLNAIRSGGTGPEVFANQSALVKAQADRDAAQRQLAALERLLRTGAASPAEVQEAQAKVKAAQVEVESLQFKQSGKAFTKPEVARAEAAVQEAEAAYGAAMNLVKGMNITAPHAGSVYNIPVKEREFVQAGELLLQSANLKSVQVRAFVDEPEIGRLSVGQPVSITWDALPGATWSGKVSQVPLTVTVRGTRNVGEVVCQVVNNDGRLLPNTNVTVNISTARRDNAVTIAREALHQDGPKRFVFLFRDGKLVRRDVQTGISSTTRIETVSGLEPNDIVAVGTLNGQPLSDGMRARIPGR